MRPIVIIPSRLGSTRLPGKALAEIHGQPMIVHAWRRGLEADIGPVVVAGGDQEIIDAVRDFGGLAILTDKHLPSGSDRAHAALNIVDAQNLYDTVVVLQGDLPTIDPAVVRATLAPLAINADCEIATLATEIESEEELALASVVKIAMVIAPGASIGRAIYFSRSPIPAGNGPHYHHIGMYAYRRQALEKYVSLPQGSLERQENLEQLRALEHGMRIDVSMVKTQPLGVDTAADLERARQLLSGKTE